MSLRFDTVRLSEEWDNCIGSVPLTGIWFVWGNSGNGKTSAVVSLCRELAAYGKVLYNSREEGMSLTMQTTLRRYGIPDLGARFRISDMTIGELDEYIAQPRSPQIIVIDSFQYADFNYRRFRNFCDRHSGKLLIFVSRANGTRPEGRAAVSAMYDASLKLWIEGHTAFSKGRFIGRTGVCKIWPEEADRYWGSHQLPQISQL